jgi:nucleotide-binding universal stress UspA family protein
MNNDGIVLCGVDATDRAATVLAAAKAAAERAGAPLLMAHVLTSLWESDVPIFRADAESPRTVEFGPPGKRLLAVARRRDVELIVVGTRGLGRFTRMFRPSVSAEVARRADCPVMIVGPAADASRLEQGAHLAGEGAEELGDLLGLEVKTEREGAAAVVVRELDRTLVRRSQVPVVVLPRS